MSDWFGPPRPPESRGWVESIMIALACLAIGAALCLWGIGWKPLH